MKIMSPWVGCRSLRKPCVSRNDLYEVLWCFLDYKTAKEGGQNRGGDFEYICPTWHVDLFHSCRKIHRNLYIVGNCYRNSCWATISWTSLNCGFTLTLQDLLTRVFSTQFFSSLVSQTELHKWDRFCLCSSEITVKTPLLSTSTTNISCQLLSQLKFKPEIKQNWMLYRLVCMCQALKCFVDLDN